MITVSVSELKANFAKLRNAAGQGETITITRRGVPVAVMTPVEPKRDSDDEGRK